MSERENPKAFKHWIGPELLEKLARELERVAPGFDGAPLRALGPALAPLELKARVRRIEEELFALLPADYPRAMALLLEASRSPSLNGFDLWPVTTFVQRRGLGHFEPDRDGTGIHGRALRRHVARSIRCGRPQFKQIPRPN